MRKGGTANVLIENQPVAVVSDRPYGCYGCECIGCPQRNRILTGINRILIQNLPMAYEFSVCDPPCVKVKSLAKTVFIGGV